MKGQLTAQVTVEILITGTVVLISALYEVSATAINFSLGQSFLLL